MGSIPTLRTNFSNNSNKRLANNKLSATVEKDKSNINHTNKMHYIQLWSQIKEEWVYSIRPDLASGMDFATAKQRVGTIQACKWQIINRHGVSVKHGSPGF